MIPVGPPVRPDVDDVHHDGLGIVGPDVEADEQVMTGDRASSFDGEAADGLRLIDLGQARPVDQGQRLDRFGQIMSPKDIGSVER